MSTDEVIDTAAELLRRHGLADLSMRRLASELGVRPGALYWHVENKQTLLVRVADRVLADVPTTTSGAPARDIRRLLTAIRTAVLPVPDGGEVVALGYALDPTSVQVFVHLRRLIGDLGVAGRDRAAATDLIVHHVLGSIAAQQDRQLAGLPTRGASAAFDRGVALVLDRLGRPTETTETAGATESTETTDRRQEEAT
nr:TetR family transcriptional regulator [Flexivirga aerilata]